MTVTRTSLGDGTPVLEARPSDSTRGLVLLHPLPGLTPAIEALTDRLATEHRLCVIAPEFISASVSDPDVRMGLVKHLADDRIFELIRTAAALTGQDEVDLIGFCTGGMYAYKASSLGIFDRLIAFYGMIRVPDYWQSASQGEPLKYLAQADTSRVMAVQGGDDQFVSEQDVRDATAAGVSVAYYPEAGHAFAHDPSQDSYRPADAEDAWRRSLSFLRYTT